MLSPKYSQGGKIILVQGVLFINCVILVHIPVYWKEIYYLSVVMEKDTVVFFSYRDESAHRDVIWNVAKFTILCFGVNIQAIIRIWFIIKKFLVMCITILFSVRQNLGTWFILIRYTSYDCVLPSGVLVFSSALGCINPQKCLRYIYSR